MGRGRHLHGGEGQRSIRARTSGHPNVTATPRSSPGYPSNLNFLCVGMCVSVAFPAAAPPRWAAALSSRVAAPPRRGRHRPGDMLADARQPTASPGDWLLQPRYVCNHYTAAPLRLGRRL